MRAFLVATLGSELQVIHPGNTITAAPECVFGLQPELGAKQEFLRELIGFYGKRS